MDNHYDIVTQVGHDLNKYLARIKAYNYLLFSRFEQSSNEEDKSFFEGIDQECDSMFRFIHNLVIADKIREDNETERENVLLNDFLKMLTRRYQPSALLKELSLQFEDHTQPLYARLHKDSFERAINNLIHNAIKFTSAKGDIKIKLSICTCNKFIDITVSDTGIGIPPALHPHIYDKFTRAGRKGVEGEESNGLGMYITKNIVEMHGGCIWFDTEEHKGTTFTIRIPGVSADA